MENLRGSSDIPSSSSEGMHKLMRESSPDSDNWEGESSGTEQSFRDACAAIPTTTKKEPREISRKSRFIEQFGSIKLTKENLQALEAGHNRTAPKPASPVDNQFRPEPSPGVKAFRISRKPLPQSARETIQKMRDEFVTQNLTPPVSKSEGSTSPRSNANFTDFLPYHQLRSWQQDDNEEWQRRRAQSFSAVASEGMKKFNSSCGNLSVQSKKTVNQLKDVIKRRMLDHDK
ncbi:hypothetical protein G6011_07890 [Alternaria panax]|uniref:Uncharacterized protein n=1 Tax=Alternaria panax TaxID=48097 RepID=A0AAD4F982_9PLEO|nr:hypothetical protein G6011_07890 [Alternaria panax]